MPQLNKEQTEKIGEIVKTLRFNPGFYKRDFLSVESPHKMAMYFYAVGICHQTYQLANPALNLYGWDFLEFGFLDILHTNPDLLIAEKLVLLSQKELIKKIKPFFAEDNDAGKCTLDRLEERADLWLDMAQQLHEKHNGKVENIFSDTKLKESEDAEILYQPLSQFQAYADPLKKKSSFLLKLLSDARLLTLPKLKNLVPIMDYHMQRVLLRTGCVEITNKKLKQQLLNKQAVSSDTEIRLACIEAMNLIAKTSGIPLFQMNDIFYMLGRSCCNESTLCTDHICEKTPCSLTKALALSSHEQCIFQSVCKGAGNAEYRNYWQPIVTTHYY